jgi:hypothetical protein
MTADLFKIPFFSSIYCGNCNGELFYLQPDGLPAVCANCMKINDYCDKSIKEDQ